MFLLLFQCIGKNPLKMNKSDGKKSQNFLSEIETTSTICPSTYEIKKRNFTTFPPYPTN